MALNEWTNYGDVNPVDHGGTFVKTRDEENSFDFFMIKIGCDRDGNTVRFAFRGAGIDIDFADYKKDLDLYAKECGYPDTETIAKENPEFAFVLLLENYGFGPMEFSATNKDGVGVYSTNMNDFLLTDGELVEFMRKEDIPEEYIPELSYHVTSKYGKVGIEDTMQTNEWEDAKNFAHEKLMSGLIVEMRDTRDGSSCILDPDEYSKNFNGEFPVDPTYPLEVSWESEEDTEF